jgi:hypothetical protein
MVIGGVDTVDNRRRRWSVGAAACASSVGNRWGSRQPGVEGRTAPTWGAQTGAELSSDEAAISTVVHMEVWTTSTSLRPLPGMSRSGVEKVAPRIHTVIHRPWVTLRV